MSPDNKIQALVDQFTADLTALVHEAALEHLESALTGVPVKRGPGRPRGSGRKKTAKKASRKGRKKATKRRAKK